MRPGGRERAAGEHRSRGIKSKSAHDHGRGRAGARGVQPGRRASSLRPRHLAILSSNRRLLGWFGGATSGASRPIRGSLSATDSCRLVLVLMTSGADGCGDLTRPCGFALGPETAPIENCDRGQRGPSVARAQRRDILLVRHHDAETRASWLDVGRAQRFETITLHLIRRSRCRGRSRTNGAPRASRPTPRRER